MRTWNDETTGRRIRQLTDRPAGCWLGYYNKPRRAGPEWVMIQVGGPEQKTAFLHAESGEIKPAPFYDVPANRGSGGLLLLNEDTGRAHFALGREIWCVDLPDGEPERVHTLPEDLPGMPVRLTCDAGTAILQKRVDPTYASIEFPQTCDAEWYWKFITRPRSGTLFSYGLADGAIRTLVEEKAHHPSLPQPSPTDPTLVAFSVDQDPCEAQHIWAVRTGGGDRWKIRPQEPNEMIMHFCWWPDGTYLTYKYQDKRVNGRHREIPFAEYSPCPTRYCLAGTDGVEVYRSDPLDHWHSHVFRSPDGTLLCGEGTHDHMFLYAAAFSLDSTQIDFVPQATIHTPYEACKGAEVESGFTPDNRWLLYNDTIEGVLQVCAVEVGV